MGKKTKTINIKGLMKIGKTKHIYELQNEGKLFCNSVKSFREIEASDKNRWDGREGAYKTEVLDPEKLSLSIKGEKMPIEFTYFRLNRFDNALNHDKLYCMFGIKGKHVNGKPFVDERNMAFGDKALIVTNTREFMTRIENKLKAKKLEYTCDYVKYYKEEKINEYLSVFHKPKAFSYQSEFRFYIKHDKPAPLVFNIGSIKSISIVIDVDDLPGLNLKPL